MKRLAKAAVEKIKLGDLRDKDRHPRPIGQHAPKQYKRVQEYIKSGIEEGAELVIGGEGHPQGLKAGISIKPTVFANVTREMRIAKEEIFGPVLSILTYKTEAEAIEIANDTEFGLIAYVSSADPERANRVARKLAAGRVLINTIATIRLLLRRVQTIGNWSGRRDLRTCSGVSGAQSDHQLNREMSRNAKAVSTRRKLSSERKMTVNVPDRFKAANAFWIGGR